MTAAAANRIAARLRRPAPQPMGTRGREQGRAAPRLLRLPAPAAEPPEGRHDGRTGAAGPEALRRPPSRSPSLHRHTAFPYELVQRQVRHLVAAPTMRRSERTPEVTPYDFRSSPRPQTYRGPRPRLRCDGAPHNPPRSPGPSFAYGLARRGPVRPAAAVPRPRRG